MNRYLLLAGLALVLFITSALANVPQVLQPNETRYSAPELAVLLPAIDQLEKALANYHLGVRRYFSPDEWDSLDFAAYTAGTLTRLGYKVKIVSQNGWPDGVHAWLLVSIPLDGKTAWIPVEAAPAPGKLQRILGRIPSYTDSAGNLWFDDRYLHFDQEVTLPKNIPPVARIRVVPINVPPGRTVNFLGVTSFDPDGEIVFYHWDFGDGSTITGRTVQHVFTLPGTYTVTLTVTDSRGAEASTSYQFTVRKLSAYTPPPSGGCGCHK